MKTYFVILSVVSVMMLSGCGVLGTGGREISSSSTSLNGVKYSPNGQAEIVTYEKETYSVTEGGTTRSEAFERETHEPVQVVKERVFVTGPSSSGYVTFGATGGILAGIFFGGGYSDCDRSYRGDQVVYVGQSADRYVSPPQMRGPANPPQCKPSPQPICEQPGQSHGGRGGRGH